MYFGGLSNAGPEFGSKRSSRGLFFVLWASALSRGPKILEIDPGENLVKTGLSVASRSFFFAPERGGTCVWGPTFVPVLDPSFGPGAVRVLCWDNGFLNHFPDICLIVF